MAEQFLTLMADLDEKIQGTMSEWYGELQKAGYTGKQTQDVPYHISLATFSPDKEDEVKDMMKKVAEEFSPVPVTLSHIGIFPGGQVLFAAPDRNPKMDLLQETCTMGVEQPYPFTPHATILIDEPEIVHAALPVFVESFRPLSGKITRLHLCAFWPTREIAAFELKEK